MEYKDNLGFNRILQIIEENTVSLPGKILANKIQPFVDIEAILSRQKQITALSNLFNEDKDIPISAFDDIREEIKRCKILNTYFNTDILSQIKKILAQVYYIKKHYHKNLSTMKSLDSIISNMNPLYNIKTKIFNILNEDNDIKDTASPTLHDIRRNITRLVNKLEKEINRMLEIASKGNWLFESNPTIRNGRLVLPLKAEAKRKIKGVVHGRSTSGNVVYLEPLAMVEINNKLKDLEDDEKAEIRKILIKLTDSIRPDFYDMSNNINLLAQLDCLRACALFSKNFEATGPTISMNDREINLINARHPILSLATEVVPLNFHITDNTKVVLITGPNAGGKTVAMKTVGLLSKMAMSGLHIPADIETKIPFFDTFHVDIGDFQSIEENLSTFSSHISHLVDFLKNCSQYSLIMIDELGTGTDPIEGASLGQAILENFIKKGAFTIATTHHGSLKAFADNSSFVTNAAMEFDTEKLSPTYNFRVGMPGSSYALELENLLIEVDREKTELEKTKFSLERNKRTLDKLVDEYNSKMKNIRKKESKIIGQKEDKLEQILLEYRAKFENTVREIKESNAKRESIKNAKQEIEKLEAEVKAKKAKKQIKQKQKSKNVDFNPGQWVELKGFGKEGIILQVQKNSNKISVDIEGKTLWVDKNNLQHLEKKVSKQDFNKISHTIQIDTNISFKLDIRGMRYDEAEAEIIKYLDKALLSGLSQAWIIHGKGTGTLQTLTQDILKNYPGIREYYFEDIDKGGSGATIVKF